MFSAAPWHSKPTPNGTTIIIAGSSVVAAVNGADNADANAALIVESPAMFGFLDEIDDDAVDVTPEWFKRVRACLIRIRGGV